MIKFCISILCIIGAMLAEAYSLLEYAFLIGFCCMICNFKIMPGSKEDESDKQEQAQGWTMEDRENYLRDNRPCFKLDA